MRVSSVSRNLVHGCTCILIVLVVMQSVDAFMLDRPLPSSRPSRDRMHHIMNRRHDNHVHLRKVWLLETPQPDGDNDNDDKSKERDVTATRNKDLVDKLTAEQRQALLQKNMNSNDNDSSEITDSDTAAERRTRNDRRNLVINAAAAALSLVTAGAANNLYTQTVYTPAGFQRFSNTKFIAATGDPHANQGRIGTAQEEQWGVWNQDPGPRGVFLRDYPTLLLKQTKQTSSSTSDSTNDSVAPAGWKFDKNDWWLEEHGTYIHIITLHCFRYRFIRRPYCMQHDSIPFVHSFVFALNILTPLQLLHS
jgi:hypothetical protein